MLTESEWEEVEAMKKREEACELKFFKFLEIQKKLRKKMKGFTLKEAARIKKEEWSDEELYERLLERKEKEFNDSLASMLKDALENKITAGQLYVDEKSGICEVISHIQILRGGSTFRHSEENLPIRTDLIEKKLRKIFLCKGWDKINVDDSSHLEYVDYNLRRSRQRIEVTLSGNTRKKQRKLKKQEP